MAFKLHGSKMSTCVRRAAVIAKERNVPYELIIVDFMAAEHKQPPHLQHHPYGQVPYMSVRPHFYFPLHLFPRIPIIIGVLSCSFSFCRISKMMASSCSSRAPSDGTSPPLALAHSSSRLSPRRMPSSSRRQASSMHSLTRSLQSFPMRK